MEPPISFAGDAVRDEKVKVLRSVRSVASQEMAQVAVRGQYGQGLLGGQKVRAYREEPGVAPDSTTETYAAVKFFIDNWRWEGVPFYLRSRSLPNGFSITIRVQPASRAPLPARPAAAIC